MTYSSDDHPNLPTSVMTHLPTHPPQRVPFVEVHEHHVGAELGLVGAEEAMLVLHVRVQLLQGLQALGQVLVVDLGVEDHGVLGAQPLGAVDVESGALLQQLHHLQAAQLLLGDLLRKGVGSRQLKGVVL